jgi:hypothetical protein
MDLIAQVSFYMRSDSIFQLLICFACSISFANRVYALNRRSSFGSFVSLVYCYVLLGLGDLDRDPGLLIVLVS